MLLWPVLLLLPLLSATQAREDRRLLAKDDTTAEGGQAVSGQLSSDWPAWLRRGGTADKYGGLRLNKLDGVGPVDNRPSTN